LFSRGIKKKPSWGVWVITDAKNERGSEKLTRFAKMNAGALLSREAVNNLKLLR